MKIQSYKTKITAWDSFKGLIKASLDVIIVMLITFIFMFLILWKASDRAQVKCQQLATNPQQLCK